VAIGDYVGEVKLSKSPLLAESARGAALNPMWSNHTTDEKVHTLLLKSHDPICGGDFVVRGSFVVSGEIPLPILGDD
jgi:hypothetical protein